MRKVCVYYNPYLESTRLVIDGSKHRASGKRLDEFVIGQPLRSYLSPCVFSYRRWNGFLSELIEELNDDEIELSFYTLPEYFAMIREELIKQSSSIEEKGYDPQLWTFAGVGHFLPEQMEKGILSFIDKEKHFLPGQHSMILMEQAEGSFHDDKELSVSKLKILLEDLNAVVEAARKDCRINKNGRAMLEHWDKAAKRLHAIYGG